MVESRFSKTPGGSGSTNYCGLVESAFLTLLVPSNDSFRNRHGFLSSFSLLRDSSRGPQPPFLRRRGQFCTPVGGFVTQELFLLTIIRISRLHVRPSITSPMQRGIFGAKLFFHVFFKNCAFMRINQHSALHVNCRRGFPSPFSFCPRRQRFCNVNSQSLQSQPAPDSESSRRRLLRGEC